MEVGGPVDEGVEVEVWRDGIELGLRVLCGRHCGDWGARKRRWFEMQRRKLLD